MGYFSLMALLEVKNLTTHLKIGKRSLPVVDGVSFSIDKGEALALVGESGAGKSMTALSLMRILPKPPALDSEGEVILNGQNLLSLSERAMRHIRGQRMGMIFQDPQSCLNPVYSIGEQLMEVIRFHLEMDERQGYERCLRALDEVGIEDSAKRFHAYPHELSGGMKQRVMIAMALLCEPEVLIADEPTTALDVTIQKQILKLIKDLQKKKGMAVLLITHDMGVVNEVADRLVVMYAGKSVESGPCPETLKNLKHPYSQALMRSLPQAHRPKERLQVIPGSVPSLTELPEGCLFHPRCPFAWEECRNGSIANYVVGKEQKARCLLYREAKL
ncbi:MAG: ABC transporter ATP-binding protein [Chlamydiia bacterium]|nr:ABC transporter ATP-binding protein [Chlamydiia bacterium]